MQAPQLVGIIIGLTLIVGGWFLRKVLVQIKWSDTGGILMTILWYIGTAFVLQHALFRFNPNWSWEGVQGYWAGFVGTLMAPVLVSMFALLSKKHRVTGYITLLCISTVLMLLGRT